MILTRDRLFSFTIAGGAAALVAAPLVSLARIAWIGDAEIWPHLAANVLPVAIVQTSLLLAGVAIITIIAGIFPAWLVTTFQFPGRDSLQWLLPLPLAIPTYIAAYIYADMLESAGPVQSTLRSALGIQTGDYWFPAIRSLGGAVFVFSIVLYPYVYLAARALFQTQSGALSEAARTLGARPWRVFRTISLPLARPAIAVGVALALLETLNDIGASEYLGVQTMTLSIFTTWLNRSSLPGAAQIALAMLVLVAGLIALERYGRRKQIGPAATHIRPIKRIALHGKAAWSAATACWTPVLLGFVFPAAFLLREALSRAARSGLNLELLQHTFNTIALAAVATLVVLAIGAAAALPLRAVRMKWLLACLAVASMGYAIPGTVLALGLMSPLVAIDEAINALTIAFAGKQVGLIVAGSSAALIVAYTVRFASMSIGMVQAGLTSLPREFDHAARLSGAGSLKILRDIHLPLLRPALAAAALLVFVDCLKELPMTLLMRPLNLETLSTSIYQYATRGSFEEGALAALLIVAAGIFPVILLVRLADTTEQRQAALSTAALTGAASA
ncbi:MAG: iron ABC transporter permease [Pseudolabrys sp.]|nr:iron ABC transporter permease [Pseudolabrys sp.]